MHKVSARCLLFAAIAVAITAGGCQSVYYNTMEKFGYLKHNLNARAIASLQTELVSVENNVDALVREMQTAISEADGFIKAMGKTT